jgi:hypothetical protein
MPQYPGHLKSYPGGFQGEFNVNEFKYKVTGNVTEASYSFKVNVATLEFASGDDLVGQLNFTGILGPDSITINFQNGTKIFGTLVDKVAEANHYSGQGSFST